MKKKLQKLREAIWEVRASMTSEYIDEYIGILGANLSDAESQKKLFHPETDLKKRIQKLIDKYKIVSFKFKSFTHQVRINGVQVEIQGRNDEGDNFDLYDIDFELESDIAEFLRDQIECEEVGGESLLSLFPNNIVIIDQFDVEVDPLGSYEVEEGFDS